MQRAAFQPLLGFVIATLFMAAGHAQQRPTVTVASTSQFPVFRDIPLSLTPLKDAATPEQIREYLRLSGDVESYRLRWIAAVDKNRSIGAPYWPESFWTSIKEEMQHTDLTPMFINVFQHGVSSDLMQEVLDAYHTLGTEHFKGSAASFKLGAATTAVSAELDKLTLANTQKVLAKVYAAYKPQIKEARARYMAEHPDWKDE